MNLPSVEAQIVLRKQRELDLGCQLQILLEGTPLVKSEVIEAILDQRIGQEPLRLDRVVAGFAQTIGPVLRSVERRVDVLEQLDQVLRLAEPGDGVLKFLSPIKQLFPNCGINESGHGFHHRTAGMEMTIRIGTLK